MRRGASVFMGPWPANEAQQVQGENSSAGVWVAVDMITGRFRNSQIWVPGHAVRIMESGIVAGSETRDAHGRRPGRVGRRRLVDNAADNL